MLRINSISEVIVIGGRVNDLNARAVGAFEDALAKLPYIAIIMCLHAVNGGEVVHKDGTDQPATSAETGHIGRRLQQTTKLTRDSGIRGSAVKGLDCTGGICQSAISTTGSSDSDVGNQRHVVRVLVDVGCSVEARNRDVAKEIPQGRRGYTATLLKPGRLAFGKTGASATNAGTHFGTIDQGRSVSIRRIWVCPSRKIRNRIRKRL